MAPPGMDASTEAKTFTRAEAEAELARRKPIRSYTNKDGVKITLYETDHLRGLSSGERAYVKLAGVIQRMGGLNVELHDTLAFAHTDGYFDTATDTLHMCLDSTTFGGAVSHELTHYIEKYSRPGWESLRDFCKAQANEHSTHGWESLIEDMAEQYGADAAESEAVASMMEGILADETAIREFCQQNETIGRKILDRLGMFLDMLKETFVNDKNSKASKWITDTEKSISLWFAALEEANKNSANETQADIPGAECNRKQLRLSRTQNIPYERQIDDFLYNRKGVLGRNDDVYIGKSQLLNRFGYEKPLAMKKRSITKSISINTGSSRSQHGISKQFMRNLPENIENSSIIVVSKSRATLLHYDGDSESPIAIGISLETNSFDVSAYEVMSVYPISKAHNWLVSKANNGDKIITLNENATSILRQAKIQYQGAENEGDISSSIKAQNEFDVNEKQFRFRPALQAGKERIAGMTPEQAGSIVFGIQPVGMRSLLDPIRMLDRSAANPETRALLYEIIEKPFNEAGGEYARNLQKHSDEYLAKMKELGIGEAESKAIQRYGEGKFQDKYGELHDYTEIMLREAFPETWQNIVKAERITRKMYDDYIDNLNEMLESVYPDVIEHAEASAEALQKRIDVTKEQAANQRKLIESIEEQIEKKADKLNRGKGRTDTQAYANLQNSLAYQRNRLANAKSLLATYEQRITVRETQKAAIEEVIRNGDVLRNRRVEHRKDYFHHFKEMEQGVGGLVNILKTNSEIDAGLAGKSDQTKPNSRWASFMQKRGIGSYKEDAVQGMLRYMTVAEYKLAYDPLIAHLRDTAKLMRASATENDARNVNAFNTWLDRWTNSIAGKSNDLDRLIMDAVGSRKVIASIRWLNSRVKSNAVLGNIRSALVQFSNLTNATTFIQNPGDWLRGMKSVAEMWAGKDKASMREIYGQSNFMSQRYLDIGTLNESVLKIPKKCAVWMLGAGDKAAAQLMWWAAYQQYTRNPGVASNMSRQYESAVDYADDITRRSVAGRGVGELPSMLTSQTLQMIVPFQTEILNTFNNLRDQFGKKNALGLIAFEMTTFALNTFTRAVFGDGVLGFDFIQAIIDAIRHAGRDDDDKEETDLSYLAQRVLGELASGIPFSAQLASTLIPNESRREKLFGDQDPTRYGTGTLGLGAISEISGIVGNMLDGGSVDPFDIADALGAILLPWGGRQLARTARGIDTLRKGYGSKIDSEGNERIQFAVGDTTLGDKTKAMLFGKWSLPEAREYLDNPSLLSAELSELYKKSVDSGMDGEHFFDLMRQMKELEPIKDEYGRTVETKGIQRARVLLEDTEIDDALKKLYIWPFIDMGDTGTVAAKADVAFAGGATANQFLRYYVEQAALIDSDGNPRKKQRAALVAGYGLPGKTAIALLDSCGGATDAVEMARDALQNGDDVNQALKWYVDGVSAVTVQYGRQIQKEAGVSVSDYIGWYRRKGELATLHKNGENKYAAKNAFQDELMQSSLTSEQKAAVERTVYGTDYSCDYTNQYTMVISRYNSSAQVATWSEKCNAINSAYGVEMKTLSEAVVQYRELPSQNKKATIAMLSKLGIPSQYRKTIYNIFRSDSKTLQKWKLGKYADG